MVSSASITRRKLEKEAAQPAQGHSPGKVFLCYRREDSGGYAIGIQDRLKLDFGAEVLFMDIDSIPLGKNFIKILDDEVAKCAVLLAVIGQNWLDARDEEGKRRLDNSNDFVRIEIAAALRRDIPVIPILLNGVRVPSARKLPEELGELSVRNGIDVRHSSFSSDSRKIGSRGTSSFERVNTQARLVEVFATWPSTSPCSHIPPRGLHGPPSERVWSPVQRS